MSTIAKAVRFIGKSAPGGWSVFSYREDFRTLWGVGGEEGDGEGDGETDAANPATVGDEDRDWAGHFGEFLELGTEQDRNIVVVWDGMPVQYQHRVGERPAHGGRSSSRVEAGGSVSPYDWAMFLSWCVYGSDALKGVKLRVCIVDVRAEGEGGEGWARRSLFFLQNAFPWIQDYRVVNEQSWLAYVAEEDGDAAMYPYRRQAAPPESRGLDLFVRDLLDPSRIMTTHADYDGVDRSDAMRWTRDLWIGNLLRAENRHSVANLVGPAILSGELGRTEVVAAGPVLGALAMALRWGGVVRKAAGRQGTGLQRLAGFADPSENYFDRRRSVRFVLVDDQYELGYHHVLGFVIWGDGYNGWSGCTDSPWRYMHAGVAGNDVGGGLTCYGDVEWLLRQVRDLGEIDDWSLPRYFAPVTGDERTCDVLLLDLRLWQDDHGRRKMMTEMVGVAAQLGIGVGDANIGPGLGRALKAAAAGGTSAEALALLPLLLSNIDRTLPIVLFSSTHQRVVSELVAGYANIISSFTKPLPGSWGREGGVGTQGWHSVDGLRAALNTAIDIHEARIAWKRLCELRTMASITDFRWRRRDGTFVDVDVPLEGEVVAWQRRLGNVFQDCVLGRSVYEGLAAPWETIENAVPAGPDEATLSIRSTRRGDLGRALKKIRNERVHGSLNRDLFGGQDGRRVGILQLLFLVDLLEGRYRDNTDRVAAPVEGAGGDPLWVQKQLVHWGSTREPRTCLHESTAKIVRRLR